MSQFHAFIKEKLSQETLRKNYRRILDGNNSKRRELVKVIGGEEGEDYFSQLRDYGHHIRKGFLGRLPQLLETLEENCRSNGMEVHYALDGVEACGLVEEIARRHEARFFIKGKSMITEEIHLNRYLIDRGYEVVESDLGEYILQIDGDTPSHLVAPAIHKTASDFSAVLKKKFPQEYLGDGDEEITTTVRNILRHKFMEADIGVSGVNFAVASSGALVLVENEGNGRLTTSMPPVHIALMSMEKVIENFTQLPGLLELLTVSATGQLITNYINIIMGPRRPDEKDGPEEVHLIIMDNGRSRILSDTVLQESLLCIRCGACMDNCPVYAQVTGHGYQSDIPGPIGKIVIPQLRGLQVKKELPGMSSLCGACEEVCPVRIPIPRILLKLREASVKKTPQVLDSGSGRGWERFLWKGWAWAYHPEHYRIFRKLAGWLTRGFGGMRWIFPLLPLVGRWAQHRSVPRPSKISLQELMRANGNCFDPKHIKTGGDGDKGRSS